MPIGLTFSVANRNPWALHADSGCAYVCFVLFREWRAFSAKSSCGHFCASFIGRLCARSGETDLCSMLGRNWRSFLTLSRGLLGTKFRRPLKSTRTSGSRAYVEIARSAKCGNPVLLAIYQHFSGRHYFDYFKYEGCLSMLIPRPLKQRGMMGAFSQMTFVGAPSGIDVNRGTNIDAST